MSKYIRGIPNALMNLADPPTVLPQEYKDKAKLIYLSKMF